MQLHSLPRSAVIRQGFAESSNAELHFIHSKDIAVIVTAVADPTALVFYARPAGRPATYLPVAHAKPRAPSHPSARTSLGGSHVQRVAQYTRDTHGKHTHRPAFQLRARSSS